MTTAVALERMTDRAQFELLATSVLRKSKPEYAGIIHTGINSRGETIVARVDGIHQIPGNTPPHYVFVQHTTTDRTRLRNKWISNRDADIPKAIAAANKIRKGQPSAMFTIVLTTNQRVDKQLFIDLQQHAATASMAVDIWEQSRISDFLDTTADGQYLRKLYLNINAELLSADLLHKIGQQSLDQYKNEALMPTTVPLVHRPAVEEILANAQPGGADLCIVRGRSGYGKSVATAQALEHWLSEGHFGLWLPAHLVQNAPRIQNAIEECLRSYYPTLEPGAGETAIQLARKAGRILLCVDDINRTPAPDRSLQQLINLATPSKESVRGRNTGVTEVPISAPLCQVIPVWPEVTSLLPQAVLDQPWIRNVVLHELLPEESAEIIRTKAPRLSTVEVCELASQLSHDPFLIGLFATLANNQMNTNQLRATAADAMEQFLNHQFNVACQVGSANLLATELSEILINLAARMIIDRNLRPLWRELESWFPEDSKEMRGIRLLTQKGHLCGLDPERRLIFRHDRLQEWFLIIAMTELLKRNDPSQNVVSDPYFSTIVGKALAKTELPPDQIAEIQKDAPWTVFEAIRQIGEPSNPHHERLFEAAYNFAERESSHSVDAVMEAICATLMETDSSRILPIIDAMPPNAMLMAAGLRNGSAQHGMRFIRSSANHHFEPGMNHGFRDRVVEHAGHHHGKQLANQIRQQLSRRDLPVLDANAYLALLGHSRFPEFDQLIPQVWERYRNDASASADALAYGLWAAARCPLKDPNNVLGPMVEQLAALPIRDDYTKMPTDREQMTQCLGWGFRRGITPEALAHLLEAGRKNQNLHPDVAGMVKDLDNPDAVEFYARHIAQQGGWSDLTSLGDGEPEVQIRSSQTTDRLREIWQSPSEPEKVRIYAFCLWLRASGGKENTVPQEIDACSPFHRYAVQHRIKLGDTSVIPELVKLLQADEMQGWWWVMAHRVWCQELQPMACQALANLQGKIPTDFSGGREDRLYPLACFIVAIPPADGEALLLQHWEHLKHSPLMVVAAFRIGTPTCVNLAGAALSLCPPEAHIFHLTFSAVWSKQNTMNPITLQHMKNLAPYLDRMKKDDIRSLAWETERAAGTDEAIADWIRRNLVALLPAADRHQIKIADESFISHLERAVQEGRFKPYLGFLFEDHSGQRVAFPEHQLQLLSEWLSTQRTVRGLAVAAECLKHIGTRQDLGLLNRYAIEGDAKDAEQLRSDAKFAISRRTPT